MEVHRHSHPPPSAGPGHGVKRKWSHYFWEFLMLFLAVTVGFFVENRREHYIEHLRVKQYARSLSYDLANDTSMINLVVSRIERNIRMTDTLANYLRERPFDQIRNINLFILTSIDRYPPYTWNRATIEQIKNSGSLRYFDEDSIVKAISAYDAFTRHMDEDHVADEEMANRASALRSQVVDMDYPKDFIMGLRLGVDSMLNTANLNQLVEQDTHSLVTKDLSIIKVYLNEKINLRKHLMIRTEEELPRLKRNAIQLIAMLRAKYKFK